MIANSQPLPAATDACNAHVDSAPGLLRTWTLLTFFSLCYSLSISTRVFFACVFVFFKAASFGIGKKKYTQEYA